MTDDRDDLCARILTVLSAMADRIERLERGREETSELKLQLDELIAEQEGVNLVQMSLNHQLARELGGYLSGSTPVFTSPGTIPRKPPLRPKLTLVVDNDPPKED